MPPRKKPATTSASSSKDSSSSKDCIILSDDECIEFIGSPSKKSKTDKPKPLLDPGVMPDIVPSASTRSKTKQQSSGVLEPSLVTQSFGSFSAALQSPLMLPGDSASSPSANFASITASMASIKSSLDSMKAAAKHVKKLNKKWSKSTTVADADSDSDTDSDSDEYPFAPAATHSSFAVMSMSKMVSSWDPTAAGDWDTSTPTAICTKRMQKDLAMLLGQEEETKIFINPNENDITRFSALIIGPKDTPYEDGFFEFLVRVGPTYPMVPPRVKNLTTDGGKVRFGPNLYAEGKVCLSILGTWTGPSWTAAMNLSATLQSIQSLMSDAALRNEPGFEKMAKNDKQVEAYDRRVRYDTIRVAVLGSLEKALQPNSGVPEKYRTAMCKHFDSSYESIVKACNDNMSFDKKPVKGEYGYLGCGTQTHTYDWSGLLSKVIDMHSRARASLDTAK